jgi:hypothetical protein
MNKININNIFSPNNKLKDTNNKNEQCLNVENLVKNNAFRSYISNDILVKKIKNNKKKDSEKLFKLYDSFYNKCLINIDNNINNLADYLFFNVDLFQYGYERYSSNECLNYIKNKLLSVGFYAEIVSNFQIFVSWKHINES